MSTPPIRRGDGSPRAWARAAGVAYLVIIASGLFGEFFVRGSLVVAGDPAATATNIAAAETLYRTGIAADLVMLMADVFLAGAIWVLFRSAGPGLALTVVFFRLAQAAALGVNLLNAYFPLLLLEGHRPPGLGAAPADALAALSLELHAYGYAAGLVFFGVHCLLLGWLVVRSGLVPRILGGLLMVAGAAYLLDTFARTLLLDYASVEAVLTGVVLLPAFVGELSFALWLLVKGVRTGEEGAPDPSPHGG